MNRREKINEILTNLETRQISRFDAVEQIEKLFKKIEAPILDDAKILQHMEIRRVFEEKIHGIRGLSDKAVRNIELRLKTFSVAECVQAIENFSRDEWQMKNNGHRSMDWFFDKDSRIETYLGMKPKSADGESQGIIVGDKTYKNEEELLEAEKRGEIYYDDRKNKFVPSTSQA